MLGGRHAAIRRAGLAGKRRTNPVVDGQLVPKSGPRRRRAPATRAAVNYDDSEPDEDEEDLELGPPDADDGWD